MTPTPHEWSSSGWWRPTDGPTGGQNALRALRRLVQQWVDAGTDLPDGAAGPTIGELREWLEFTEVQLERGVQIRDEVRGVSYRVTLRDGVQLRTVEIITSSTDRTVFRVPVDSLAAEARSFISLQDHHQAEGTIIISAKSAAKGRPTPETLVHLARNRVLRKEIARRYDRALTTVDQWFREARRDHPDLDWPERRTPGTKTPSAAVEDTPGESQQPIGTL